MLTLTESDVRVLAQQRACSRDPSHPRAMDEPPETLYVSTYRQNADLGFDHRCRAGVLTPIWHAMPATVHSVRVVLGWAVPMEPRGDSPARQGRAGAPPNDMVLSKESPYAPMIDYKRYPSSFFGST